MGGGASWEPEPSILVCKAYFRASENCSKGAKVPIAVFQQRVKTQFELLIRDALDSKAFWITKSSAAKHCERTGSALVARYKKTKSKCLVFDCHLKTIKAGRPTGDPKEEDFERAALAIYNKEGGVKDMYRYLRGEESPGKPFPYCLEYHFLRTIENFRMIDKSNGLMEEASVPKDAVQSSGGGDSPSYSGQESDGEGVGDSVPSKPNAVVNEVIRNNHGFKRFIGSKKASALEEQTEKLKRRAKGIESLARASHKKARIQENAVSVEREKASVDMMKATMELFSMKGACPQARALFIDKMQKKTIADLEAKEKKKKAEDEALRHTSAPASKPPSVSSTVSGAEEAHAGKSDVDALDGDDDDEDRDAAGEED